MNPEIFKNPETKDINYYRQRIENELKRTREMVEAAKAEGGGLSGAIFDLRATLYGLAMEMAGESRKADIIAMQN